MKNKSFGLTYLTLLAGLALGPSSTATAGGNTGQMIARFEPVKLSESAPQFAEGDSVVKVCRACNVVMLVRIEKGGKGRYDVAVRKCDNCGSPETYLAMTRQNIPFKEQIKR